MTDQNDTGTTPAPVERIFGATSIVDSTPLVYDETNAMWVYAENHDEPWLGVEPVATIEDLVTEEVVVIDAPVVDAYTEIEVAVEAALETNDGVDVDVNISEETNAAGDTFVRVNIDPVATLRLREDSTVDGAVLSSLVNDTVLRVVSDDNPEWALVETEVDGEVVQGYVKRTYIVPTPAPNE